MIMIAYVNSQICSFCRKLKHHYFYFTPISVKSSEAIPQKYPRDPIFGSFETIFSHFYPKAFFPTKTGFVTQTPMGHNTLSNFRKSNRPIPREVLG